MTDGEYSSIIWLGKCKFLRSKGRYAIVDNEDYEWLSQWNWSGEYATRTEKGRLIIMHRLILKTPKGKLTDHINRNKLDNRKANLRVCSNAENIRNIGMRSHNTSGYKGVHKHRQSGRWRASIRVDGKNHNLGLFKNPKDAAQAYILAAKKYHGNFAPTE